MTRCEIAVALLAAEITWRGTPDTGNPNDNEKAELMVRDAFIMADKVCFRDKHGLAMPLQQEGPK